MDLMDNNIDYNDNNESNDDNKDKRCGRMRRPSGLTWDQYVYTIAMFINHFTYGLNYGVLSPTLVDLKYVFNTTMNMISIGLVFTNIGYLSGSLFGLLYKYINRQLTIGVVMTAMAISVALIPFCPTLWTLFLCQYMNGLGAGIWDSANNVWLVEMWPKKSLPMLQFSQFMYGLGTVFGPILVKPYLTGEDRTPLSTSTPMTGLTDDIVTATTAPPVDRRALLTLPFLISGFLQGIIPIVLLIMFFIKQYKSPEHRLKRKDSSESLLSIEDENGSQTDGSSIGSNRTYSSRMRATLIGLLSAFIAIYCSLEIAHFNYSSTYYQFISLRISAQKSAEILSVMSTSYTFGRCVSAFIAIKIGPKVMIIYHLLIIIVGMAVLYYGQHVLTLIWIGNIILGFGFSAMYSAIIALTAKHIHLTDTVSTIMIFSNGVVSAVTPFILGPLIETNPFVFIELELCYLIFSALLFLVILTVIDRADNRSGPQTIVA